MDLGIEFPGDLLMMYSLGFLIPERFSSLDGREKHNAHCVSVDPWEIYLSLTPIRRLPSSKRLF